MQSSSGNQSSLELSSLSVPSVLGVPGTMIEVADALIALVRDVLIETPENCVGVGACQRECLQLAWIQYA